MGGAESPQLVVMVEQLSGLVFFVFQVYWILFYEFSRV